MADDVPAQIRLAAERQRESHEFSPAKEHEFCSWCGAPQFAPCHGDDEPVTAFTIVKKHLDHPIGCGSEDHIVLRYEVCTESIARDIIRELVFRGLLASPEEV